MKRATFIFFFFLIGCCADATADGLEFLHGTYYVFFLTRDYVVISIDSRLSESDGSVVNDRVCKLLPLDKNHVFFSYGDVQVAQNEKIILDVFKSAKSAFTGAVGSTNPLDAVAQTYSPMIIKEFHDVEFNTKVSINEGFLLYSYFAGAKIDGTLTAFFIDISKKNGLFTASATDLLPDINPRRPVEFDGLYQELLMVKTERAKTLFTQVRPDVTNKSRPAEFAAKIATYIIQGMINWSNAPRIGGEPATIIIPKDGNLTWFRHPDFCG